MRKREYLQENRVDIGISGTKTYNLDYTDPISELLLYFEATNGANDNKASPIETCISKIEIVDGGEVLWDSPGDVALGLYATDNEGIPLSDREECGGGSIRQVIPIRFGRHLWDRMFAFNPIAHRNPQVRFTFDEATVNTAGADGYSSDSWTFSLAVRLMEDAESPSGFLSLREVETYTSVGSGIKRVEMPTDRIIRYLINRARVAGTSLKSIITNHKLSVDGGKYVPFDLASEDFLNLHCQTFKPLWFPMQLSLTDATVSYTWMGYTIHGGVSCKVNDVIACGSFYDYDSVYARVCDTSGTSETDRDSYVSPFGWGIHNVIMYAFGDRNIPDDWLNPMAFNKLDYFMTDGTASADVNVCVQQLYPY